MTSVCGTMVARKCKCCKETFYARLADVKRGWGLYCSKSCKAFGKEKPKQKSKLVEPIKTKTSPPETVKTENKIDIPNWLRRRLFSDHWYDYENDDYDHYDV